MVGAGAAGIKQPHRIALVAKGGLHPNKNIAEVAAIDQKMLAIAIKFPGRFTPVFLQPLGVGGEPFVFFHRHAMGDG